MRKINYARAGVYMILNVVNNKCYVGSSYNVLGRLTAHEKNLMKNRHRNSKLQSAYNKYGKKSFQFLILQFVNKIENLLVREQYYIDYYDSCDFGYNLSPDATSTLGVKLSKITRKRMSESRSGELHHMYGKKHTQESIEKMKSSCVGRIPWNKGKTGIYSNEYRAKLSISHLGKTSGMKGKKHTEESKMKNRIAHTGKNNVLYMKERTEEEKLKMSEGQKRAWVKRRKNGKDIPWNKGLCLSNNQ